MGNCKEKIDLGHYWDLKGEVLLQLVLQAYRMRDTSVPAVSQSMSEFIMQIGRLWDCKSSYSATQK